MPGAVTVTGTTATTSTELQTQSLLHDHDLATTVVHTQHDPNSPSLGETECSDEETRLGQSSARVVDIPFAESTCLFCDVVNADLDTNLVHMSKSHGLHVDQTNLLVNPGDLLSYFHLLIHGYHECLYCGKQRHSLDAIRQHMIAKGHCKYDILDEDSEFREFYNLSASADRERLLQRRALATDNSHHPLRTQPRRTPETRHMARQSTSDSHPAHDRDPDREMHLTHLGVSKSTRSQKQECIRSKQLSSLRADDRRGLMHLSSSQQRSILASCHGQLAGAARSDQGRRTRLETAGNRFNRLGTTRLVRQPPHFGHVVGLNR